jgi:hypothetical protein
MDTFSTLARRVVTTAPVTTLYLLSTGAFWLIMVMLPDSRLNVVLFYIFALPSYLGSLVATVVSTSFGWTPGWWVPVGLSVAADVLIVFPVRWFGRAALQV